MRGIRARFSTDIVAGMALDDCASVQAAPVAEYRRLRGAYGVPPETFEAPFPR